MWSTSDDELQAAGGTGERRVIMSEVIDLLDAFRADGARVWLAGGWGVDALLGRQTRPHSDVDVFADVAHEEVIVDHLQRRGYEIVEDFRPTRVSMLDRGHDEGIDVLFLECDASGSGVWTFYDGMPFPFAPDDLNASGQLGATPVVCISARAQIAFNNHHAEAMDMVRDLDRIDVRALARRYHLVVPPMYRRRATVGRHVERYTRIARRAAGSPTWILRKVHERRAAATRRATAP